MNKTSENFIIRAEGGLGAQICAVAAYFYLKKNGYKSLIDLSYFDIPYREAEIGKPQVTHWDWQLDYYGIDKSNLDWISLKSLEKYSMENLKDRKEGLQILNLNNSLEKYFQFEGKEFTDYKFNDLESKNIKNIRDFCADKIVVVHDGPNKAKLFINAMQDEIIKNKFYATSKEWEKIVKDNNINFQDTVFLHLRRGDYLNVASHLISTDDIIRIFRKLPKVIKNTIVFSDSKKEDNLNFISELENIFNEVKWMDKIDNVNAHKIMTEASFLVCSNSQFSTTAAYLGKGFSLIPQKFSSDKDHVFQYENKQTSFALLNN